MAWGYQITVCRANNIDTPVVFILVCMFSVLKSLSFQNLKMKIGIPEFSMIKIQSVSIGTIVLHFDITIILSVHQFNFRLDLFLRSWLKKKAKIAEKVRYVHFT